MKFNKCEFGGGHSCEKQGGNGFLVHPINYEHTYHIATFTKSISSSSKIVTIPLLENTLLSEDEISKALFFESFKKSLYYFDLDSPKGIARLIELLPVLSDDIIGEVYSEIWPDYPVDDPTYFNVRMARSELRGYLLDYMYQNDFQDPTEERPREIDSAIS